MVAGYIYIVTNVINGRQYVGLTTKTAAVRWQQHVSNANNGVKTYLYAAIRKYGAEAFTVETCLSVLDKKYLGYFEKQKIQDLNAAYNQTNGGEVTLGRKYDDATKERIRLKSLGKKRTPAQIEKMKQAVRNSAAHTARRNSPENMVLLREMCKKVDHEKRLAALRAVNVGKVWSAESRAKLSASCMGRVYNKDIIDKMRASKRKKVLCRETGVVFLCTEEAAQHTGVSKRTIHRDCKGLTEKTRRALTFTYI